MKALARFESFVENLMEGSFTRVFGGKIHLVQIAKLIEREMESHQTVGPGRIFVPNLYFVTLSPSDFEEIAPAGQALADELRDYASNLAEERGFSFLGPVAVEISQDETLPEHQLRVRAEVADVRSLNQAPSTPSRGPALDETLTIDTAQVRTALQDTHRAELLVFDGPEPRHWPVTLEVATIGRALDNDLVIEHPSVSRHHAELRRQDGRRFYLVDLQSTNGMKVNGRQLIGAFLQDGDRITLGSVEVQFRLVPSPDEG